MNTTTTFKDMENLQVERAEIQSKGIENLVNEIIAELFKKLTSKLEQHSNTEQSCPEKNLSSQ